MKPIYAFGAYGCTYLFMSFFFYAEIRHGLKDADPVACIIMFMFHFGSFVGALHCAKKWWLEPDE